MTPDLPWVVDNHPALSQWTKTRDVGDLIQFVYGEDGTDGAFIERPSIDTFTFISSISVYLLYCRHVHCRLTGKLTNILFFITYTFLIGPCIGTMQARQATRHAMWVEDD
jgi:hypothetical protein